MNRPIQTLKLQNERGSALVIVVLILAVVAVLGILSTRTATIELQVASHDKLHKMNWYATESVCDGLMPELIEKNIEDRHFGNQTPPFNYGPTTDLFVHKTSFWENTQPNGVDIEMNALSESDVSVCTYCTIGLLPGSGTNMNEGYAGLGEGAGRGGAQRIYTISGLGRGPAKSEARVVTGWRHVI